MVNLCTAVVSTHSDKGDFTRTEVVLVIVEVYHGGLALDTYR
jgi:hypothetical protein